MSKDNKSILNKKDVLILQKLLEDGRKSSSSISKEINLGREIVNYRIKRLIKKNLIIKFIPKVDEEYLCYKEHLILIKLNLEDEISKQNLINKTIGNKYLLWMIKSGESWDLIIRLFSRDYNEFKIKLNEILENFAENLTNYYTIITSDEIKQETANDLFNIQNFKEPKQDYKKIKEPKKFQLDKIDYQILDLLGQDARIQYKEISNQTDLSADSIKYRIEKMKLTGIIKNFIPILNMAKLGFIQYVFILKFNYLNLKEEENLQNYFIRTKEFTYVIKSLNSEEYFCELTLQNSKLIEKIEKEIRKLGKLKLLLFEKFQIK